MMGTDQAAAVSLAHLYHKTHCKLPVLEIRGLTGTSMWCLDFGGKAHRESVVTAVSLLLYPSGLLVCVVPVPSAHCRTALYSE